MRKKYSIGLDFGTNSCRSLIVDISDGNELASHVFQYPSGEAGVIINPSDPNFARQNSQDYIKGIEICVSQAINSIKEKQKDFDPIDIIGIGVDTTGSSPMPVDASGMPLSLTDPFKNNPDGMVWLWKDHTSYTEARQITELARKSRPQYLSKIGGVYSSEWFWSKILHLKNINPDVYDSAFSFVEICDYITAHLVGDLDPLKMKRSICAAGHKAMFNKEWDGLPDKEFLDRLSAGLGELRNRLYNTAVPSESAAGKLSREWANKLGLSENVTVCTGAFDAHMGAVGAGIQAGTLVKILGTSTCDIMVAPNEIRLPDIPGVCGIVDGSVMGGYYGIEAGQSAVGDIFLWFVNQLVPEKYGNTTDEKFETLGEMAAELKPGESGLLALDWNNGNRTILVDVRLTGLLLGQTLHTQVQEIYRALIEATAFGALTIINRIEENGVPINEIVNCGGLAQKNPLLMQIYADITGRPMRVSRSEQTPALGAAIFGAVAAGVENGGYANVPDAQKNMTGIQKEFQPDLKNHETYKKLYLLYKQLHDSFGTVEWSGKMNNVMKNLLTIRDEVRKR